MRWTLAVILASVVVYAWGFYFWRMSGLPRLGLHRVEEPATAGEALLEHYPEAGVYFIPGYDTSAENIKELHNSGPLAVVYMNSIKGRKPMDFGILYSGACHIILTCIFLCFLIGLAGRSLGTFPRRASFFIFLGFFVAFYSEIGSFVWWQYPWDWQLVVGLYDWIAISLGGIVISAIAPRAKPVEVKTA